MKARRLIIGFTTFAATTALAVTLPSGATAASTDSAPTTTVLSSAVVAPFQLATFQHRLYVADGGTSLVSRVTPGGLATVRTGPVPGEVAGLAFDSSGAMAYTSTNYADGQTALTIHRAGHPDVVADLSGYEKRNNPDAHIWYGAPGASACARKALDSIGAKTYRGVVDSHPYSVVSLGDGSWVVADAAGNDLLKVDSHGTVSTLAKLPRQPLRITAAMAKGMGLPRCVGGVTYSFEPVPTDVEVAPGGQLLVTTLPGGPEDASLGARGSVYRVNRTTGAHFLVATGFLGATNLAVDSHGTIYVAELFAGRISTVAQGRPKPFLTLPSALAVEVDGGQLYAATMAPMDDQGNPTGNGTVVRVNR